MVAEAAEEGIHKAPETKTEHLELVLGVESTCHGFNMLRSVGGLLVRDLIA